MFRSAVIADEVTAAGYRLAGAETCVSSAERAAADLDAACARAELVLLTAELAAHVPTKNLERLLLGTRPLVLLIQDAGGRVPLPDIGAKVRRTVGLDT